MVCLKTMGPKLTALCLIVVSCLLAGTAARSCEPPADCAAPAPAAQAADEPEPPSGPARIVDESFNEIAATDDDDPDLAAALYAYHVRAEVLKSRTIGADDGRGAAGEGRPETNSGTGSETAADTETKSDKTASDTEAKTEIAPKTEPAATTGPRLAVPALIAVALVLLFMAGCVAMARWRPGP